MTKKEQIEKALEDETFDALKGGVMACGRVIKLQETLKQEIIEESKDIEEAKCIMIAGALDKIFKACDTTKH